MLVKEDERAAKNITVAGINGESILNCSRSPLCLAGWAAGGFGVGGIAKGVKLYNAARAAQAAAAAEAGTGGATAANAGFSAVAPVGGWMGATTATTGGRAAALRQLSLVGVLLLVRKERCRCCSSRLMVVLAFGAGNR